MALSDDEDHEEHRQRRKRARKQLEQDLRATQEEKLRIERENQRLNEELAQLRHNRESQEDDNLPAAQTPEESAKDEWKRRAASAGRRASVMHMPFMDANYLFDHRVQAALPQMMEDVQKSVAVDDPDDNAEDLPDGEQDPRKYWDYYRFDVPDSVDMVREILYQMPPHAGKRWFKTWFKSSFLNGYGKIRSDVVFHVSKNHLLIFGIADINFKDKRKRSQMAEVKELRTSFQYEFVDGRPDIKSFYRHDCIVKTVRYILMGESSISTGERSSKARTPHSVLWKVTEVTPSILAFAATVIDFVLSGDSTFELVTSTTNYLDYYKARLELMRSFQEAHPPEFDELILYHNKQVFRHLYPEEGDEIVDEDGVIPRPDRGMNQSDMAFLEGL